MAKLAKPSNITANETGERNVQGPNIEPQILSRQRPAPRPKPKKSTMKGKNDPRMS